MSLGEWLRLAWVSWSGSVSASLWRRVRLRYRRVSMTPGRPRCARAERQAAPPSMRASDLDDQARRFVVVTLFSTLCAVHLGTSRLVAFAEAHARSTTSGS
jgi:hypothetical protein